MWCTLLKVGDRVERRKKGADVSLQNVKEICVRGETRRGIEGVKSVADDEGNLRTSMRIDCRESGEVAGEVEKEGERA